MDGLIILNKPLNISSHDAVFKVKKILKEKKVGHTGTLDPLASGILIICLGKATKLSQYLTTDTKSYRAKIMLGLSTKTYDLEGEVEDECDVDVSLNQIDETINSFLGKSMQYPPLYSAIKKDGKKLYEYALKGEDVKVEPREIEVFSAKRVSLISYENKKIVFEVDFNVSKGTYIRSIAHDFGVKLGVPSVLAGLVRQECSGFTLEDSCTLEDVEQNHFKLVKPLDALKDYLFVSDSSSIAKAKNGMKISYRYIKDLYNSTPSKFVVCESDQLIAIYKLAYNEELKTNYYKADTVWS